MNPTEALRITKEGALSKWQDQSNSGASWIVGITKFRNQRFGEILKELERQYNINIETENIDLEERVSCNFQHDNLEKALITASSPMEIQFEIINRRSIRFYK